MLTEAQKQSFECDGFLVVPDAVPLELVQAMRAEAEVMVQAEPPDVHRRVWHERAVFRRAAAIEDNTWRRAAGWALNLSLAYLTGDDSTSMPLIGRTTLNAVLAEFG